MAFEMAMEGALVEAKEMYLFIFYVSIFVAIFTLFFSNSNDYD
jgi:hypothetical protein